MPIPSITHLQAAVLQLVQRTITGAELRQYLKSNYGITIDGPAFYQLMARMEGAHLVIGEYSKRFEGKQIIKERHYTITVAGSSALATLKKFYQHV